MLFISLVVAALTIFAHADTSAAMLQADTIVAERGGAVVTLADVDAALLKLPKGKRADMMNSPRRIEDTISQLLLTRQLANSAREQKIDEDTDVKRAIELAAEGVLGTQYILMYREALNLGDVELLARERYDANPSAFDMPEYVSAYHILIDTEKRTDAEAAELIEELRQRAQKEDFIQLVKEYSDDPSKSFNDGLIADAATDKMAAEFAEAAANLQKPGEISPVVKTQFGYHILKLDSRKAATPRSWDEVKDQAVARLQATLSDQRVKEHVDQMRSMTLDANPDAVASLRTRYLPTPAAATPVNPASPTVAKPAAGSSRAD
ncbi:MAG: peptidylprolyl isomerase [Dokdonella sp.]